MKKLLLALISLATSLYASEHSWHKYQKEVLSYQKSIPGWCTIEKAHNMMHLIHETNPQLCVEIGVFGGSSIYPTASALKYMGSGIVYAIDPWMNPDCLQGYTSNDPNYQWWGAVDLEKIFKDFKKMLKEFDLTSHCKVLRMTSAQAVLQFADQSIDILHIDGNHTEKVALLDAQMFLPKVKTGGYIWFDDVNWSSTNEATRYLMKHCVMDMTRSTDSYYLLRKL